MSADGAVITKSYKKKKDNRSQFDEQWERMAPYLSPSRAGINKFTSPGDKQTRGVYDSTGMLAVETHAHFIAGHIINPSQRWFSYRLRDRNFRDDEQIVAWLEECRDITLDNYTASLFYAEGPESLVDYSGFGTGYLICEEAPQPVNKTIKGFRGFYVKAQKTGRFCIEEGATGTVNEGYTEDELTVKAIRDQFGESNLPNNIQECIRNGNWDKTFKILHAVYPRPSAEQNGYAATGMPWASCWIDLDSSKIIKESGLPYFHAAVPRYHRTPGEVFGRGRGELAFPDIWTLNSAKRMALEDWALKIRPPVMVRSGSVMGTLKLIPGGPLIVNTMGQALQNSLAPFQTGSHPEVSQINEEELRKSIREVLYVDAIRQLMQVEKSEMTAYEFAKKIELLFRLLGPVYGRLEFEYLHSIVGLSFEIQYAAKAFPPPPPSIEHTDGQIDIIFQNPIAKAQRSGDAEALLQSFNDLAPFVNMGRVEVLDRLDPSKVADGIYALRGVPAKWMRSDDEVATLRSARDQQNQKDNQLAQLESVTKSAQQAAPAIQLFNGGKRAA